jgi:NADPH:quinone reductase-like Zn-dependent oxidoreductase
MRAIVQRRYGGTETLESHELPAPRPGKGEVLVRVAAAGVDRGTVHLMTGLPLVMRPATGLRRPRQPVPGRALSGVVEAVGTGVSRFRPGDAVFGTTGGSLAELVVCQERRLAAKPDGLTFEAAAAVPVSGQTALRAVRAARVTAGQSVLVLGASGGVGSFVVQLAKAAGARVTAVASAGKADLVRSLGADEVLDYARSDVTAAGGRYDAILDIAGSRPVSALRRVLAPTGTLVLVGGEEGGRWLGGMMRPLGAAARSPFLRQRLVMLSPAEDGADLVALAELVADGSLRPAVERVFELDDAAKAIEHLEAGHARGKLVVRVSPPAA